MFRGLVLASAFIVAPLFSFAADVPATITVMEGDALIYRGVGRVHAAEGVRMVSGDIVETGPKAFVQMELPDKSVLQFGPSTRAMFNASSGRQKAERWVFIMNGWCKAVWPMPVPQAAAPGLEVRTKFFDIPAVAGAAVLHITPSDASLFDERGDLKVSEHQASGNPLTVALRSGEHYRRTLVARGEVNSGGLEAFLAGMPRAFRDSLPPRIDRFRDEDVRPKDAPDFTYADVEAWLNAEPWLRRPFVQRWRSKAKDPAFRAALIGNLSAHPEWDPILFPEKYVKKVPVRREAAGPVPSASAAAPSGSTQ